MNDAIVYSLYNFSGVKGQKALLLLTDGRDTVSKFSFEQALEYAPDLGERFRRRPGTVQPDDEVEMVDGGLDGERGQEVGHGQHPALCPDQVSQARLADGVG